MIVLVVFIELLYIVMLVYDDIVDEVDMCCGLLILCLCFGNSIVVYIGDYFFVCCFKFLFDYFFLLKSI